MNIKKLAVVVVLVAGAFATSGCLTSEFWNCCLFGQTPVQQGSEGTSFEEPRLPHLTRQALTPSAMSY